MRSRFPPALRSASAVVLLVTLSSGAPATDSTERAAAGPYLFASDGDAVSPHRGAADLGPPAEVARPNEEGIPVTSDVVIDNCVSCHARDEEGRMSRISYARKTPEGWESTLLRMVALQDVEIDPEDAREIVRYLSNRHGLAPEELRPHLWAVERRTSADPYPDEEVRQTCAACHSMGEAVTQRRTEEEWRLLTETHRGYFPLVDNQVFRGGGGGDEGFPVDRAVEHLAEAYPMVTRAWEEWSAAAPEPQLEGRWAIVGEEIGRGPVLGTVEVEAAGENSEMLGTRTTLHYPREGTRVVREGDVQVYTGYQWRGRSHVVEAEGADDTLVGAAEQLREVLFVERDGGEMHGRWFTGAYDELGLDVTVHRIGLDPTPLGVHPRALRSDGEEREVRVYGGNLPADPDPADLDFGAGIDVVGVAGEAADGGLRVRVRVRADARTGPRDLRLAEAALPDALVVFDRADYLRVEPEAGMARVGGVAMPKQYERFEAIAYHAGEDGEPGTDDDLRLGPVEASWEIVDYPIHFGVDNEPFVGSIDDRGFFTPFEDGPNPERPGDANNLGDVWVVARHDPPAGGPALEARAYLLVTVPVYIRWDSSRLFERPEQDVPGAADPQTP